MEITKKQKLTQRERILDYIEKYGYIDRKKSYEDLGIVELSARLKDLERLGYSFDKIRKAGKSRLGYKFNFVEYRLKQYDTASKKETSDA